MTKHEIEEKMESLSCELVFLDSKIHDLLRIQVRSEDKYAELRKEIDDKNNSDPSS